MIDPNSLCLGCMKELENGETVCKHCGWNNAEGKNAPHQLIPGTVLMGKYLLGKVLGEGGFGITYIGWNLLLGEKIAIKEFYPQGFVSRDSTVYTTVLPYVGREKPTEKAKESFIKEARTMASLSNVDGIVEMKDVFTENMTVYIVMGYVEGKTLKTYVKENGNKLSMDKVLELLKPVMEALGHVHSHGLIHRDISPDNIMVTPEGKVILLDFGAARQISADGGHSLTVNVKHGYAPIEQYQTRGEQGPWTDVYALCATIYRLITGKVAPNAADRALDDCLVRPSVLGADITPEQENALLRGLAVRRTERYSNMSELIDALFNNGGSAFVPVTEPEPQQEPHTTHEYTHEPVSTKDEKSFTDGVYPPEKKKNNKALFIILPIIAVCIIAAVIYAVIPKQNEKYNIAIEYMEDGEYEKALLIFEDLDGFGDSAEQINICNEKINDKSYKSACALMDEEKYAEAIAIFEGIADFKDASGLMEKCQNELDEVKYQEAMALFEKEEYEQAMEILEDIRGYKDSEKVISQCEAVINEEKYQEALALFNSGELATAEKIFNEIKGYKDSGKQLDLIKTEKKYLEAVALMDSGKYEEAIEAFTEIGDYKDSQSKIRTCKAKLAPAPSNSSSSSSRNPGSSSSSSTPGGYVPPSVPSSSTPQLPPSSSSQATEYITVSMDCSECGNVFSVRAEAGGGKQISHPCPSCGAMNTLIIA